MRVLITSWAWPTHYYPLVPLAWALRSAGHEVRVAGQPGLANAVTGSGMPFVPVGRDLDMEGAFRRLISTPPPAPGAQGQPAPGQPAPGGARKVPRAIGMFADLADVMAEDTIALARDWRPNLVISDPTALVGALAAKAVDAPLVRFPWGADIMSEVNAMPGMSDVDVEAMAPIAERFGLRDVRPREGLTLDHCPTGMQVAKPAPHRQDIRYLPYNAYNVLPPALPAPTRPRVCVSWGTTIGRLDPTRSLMSQVITRIVNTGVEVVAVVAAHQRGDLLASVPEGVIVAESAPIQHVLAGCSAVISHGGVSTILNGLLHGLPQLAVAPVLPDHRFNSRHLAASGAGRVLTAEEVADGTVVAALQDVLDTPGYRTAAEKLRGQIEEKPLPAEVVPILEQHAS
ncbi:UDP:flavonoid glycosyltransferase YjiC, YdhE family [Micromonospora pallida]|uniref:UDP:flavonoid glycosyltransferase YjiC, YdhE family n=1 Tax=Micromonospora pallida TaxID=145854 RepID=A0A1C6SB69_9ACTN|nr:nucleotide disphospho-sugar-binding domain-containing protein [Micromonospora pallida]SCL26656.1 UDP:flavonoid glycosyltransferase YjiC, YdhE family [Micromonospora pallida]